MQIGHDMHRPVAVRDVQEYLRVEDVEWVQEDALANALASVAGIHNAGVAQGLFIKLSIVL